MASTIKVNNIQNQCGANIVNKCSTTITLGASGDTIQLACGASQTGFGRTGTVDWDTTAKTTNFTAVSGVGYFVNTTSGAVTMTLPATPSAGDIVSVKDYAGTFATNNLTIARNGSNLDGTANDKVVSTNFQNFTMVYVDGTQGWIATDSGTDTIATLPAFVTATGGTVTCCGDYKIHTFTAPGTFTVTCAGNPAGSNSVDYLVVAGGGGGGNAAPTNTGGGGGAGGFRESSGTATGCYTASPLGACVSALPISVTAYPITVGGGGSGAACQACRGSNGSNSVFSTITSTGGGGAGSNGIPVRPGNSGGSGGGGSGGAYNIPGGTGNTPPVSPPQGNNGGDSTPGSSPPDQAGGGGGGATEAGVNGSSPGIASGRGGAGGTTSISASPVSYAGGGGGGGSPTVTIGASSPCGTGGAGGNSGAATAGTTNRGGGGGGNGNTVTAAANGGSGIVIIRYKYQ